MAQTEQVLVVERAVLERIGMFQGLTFDVDRYFDELFAPGVPRFMPRPEAEADPNFKQLIPYVVMTHGGKYLSYVRGKRAGETRLVGHRSLGIGGHINPIDESPLFDTDFKQTYFAAVAREVEEEVSVEADHTDQIVALINDDSTEVGRVHMGLVHYWSLSSPDVAKREQMITQMELMTPDELHKERDNLETWSQLCLDNLDAMARRVEENATVRRT